MMPEPKDEVLASLEELVGLAIMPDSGVDAYLRWQDALERARLALDKKKMDANAGLMTPFGQALSSLFRVINP